MAPALSLSKRSVRQKKRDDMRKQDRMRILWSSPAVTRLELLTYVNGPILAQSHGLLAARRKATGKSGVRWRHGTCVRLEWVCAETCVRGSLLPEHYKDT
jgi:hypothetical protein